jgi:homoserine kinase
MALTANTVAAAEAVDTTVITKRYSGELAVSGSGTSHFILYTCPSDKQAYVYLESFYVLNSSNGGSWWLYISNTEKTSTFPGTYLWNQTSNCRTSIQRLANGKLIGHANSNSNIDVGLALPSTGVSTYTTAHLPTYSTDYATGSVLSGSGSTNIAQELRPRIILNPTNQFRFTKQDNNVQYAFWDFFVEEHTYTEPT